MLAYIKEGSVIKTLYIIRHAKSSWKDLALDDFERPLNKRGKRDAPVIGERLAKNQVMPDIILSSPAKRAKMTAKIIANKVHYGATCKFNPSKQLNCSHNDFRD